MLLAVDIGNTNVVIAVYKDMKITHTVRTKSDFHFWDDFQHFKKYDITGIVISCVVPNLLVAYVEGSKNLFGIAPMVINTLNSGVSVNVDDPAEVGADRLCNVAGAVKQYGAPCIVVDFGTATTYDVVDEKGVFLGGAIAPGIDVSAKYLFNSAALLRETAFTFPASPIGKNTITNLQAGIMFSAVDEVDGMIRRIRKETAWENSRVILTGGFSSLISRGLNTEHSLAPDLTLDGMRIIYSRFTQ